MKHLINIGRLVEGIHHVMGRRGSPDEKMAEILGTSVKKIWERITGGDTFTPAEFDAIAAHFGHTAEALMLRGDGIIPGPVVRPKVKRTRSKVYRKVQVGVGI